MGDFNAHTGLEEICFLCFSMCSRCERHHSISSSAFLVLWLCAGGVGVVAGPVTAVFAQAETLLGSNLSKRH